MKNLKNIYKVGDDKIKTIDSLIKESKLEVKKFEDRFPRDKVHLIQAAEKTWVAYNLFLERILGYNMLSAEDVRAATKAWAWVNKDRDLEKLYQTVKELHIYHYEARLSSDIVKRKLKTAWQLLAKERKRYKV
ncbi:MAG: hypothetical protein ACE5KE_00710 [Methanosarcinales archaeon]